MQTSVMSQQWERKTLKECVAAMCFYQVWFKQHVGPASHAVAPMHVYDQIQTEQRVNTSLFCFAI